MLLILCFLSVIIGIISDLIRTNRVLIEDTLKHTKRMRFGPAGQRPATSYWSESESPQVVVEAGQPH